MLKALDRFDPELEYEFAAYAVPTILGELRRYFRDFGWVMRLSRAEQELAAEVKQATEEASRRLGRNPTPREVAAGSRLSAEDVIRGLEAATAAHPASLDMVDDGSSDISPGLARCLGREDDGFEQVESRDAVTRGLHALPARDSQILRMRFYEDLNQSEIAERIGVSQMQVSRLIRRALEPSRWLAELGPSVPTPNEEESCSSHSQSSC